MSNPLEEIDKHMPFDVTPNHKGVVKAIHELAKKTNAIGLDPGEFNMLLAYLIGCNSCPLVGEDPEHKAQILKAFDDGYEEFRRWYLLTQTQCAGSA